MSASSLKRCVSLCLVVIAIGMTNAANQENVPTINSSEVSIPTEADVHSGLICFKEINFFFDAIKEDP